MSFSLSKLLTDLHLTSWQVNSQKINFNLLKRLHNNFSHFQLLKECSIKSIFRVYWELSFLGPFISVDIKKLSLNMKGLWINMLLLQSFVPLSVLLLLHSIKSKFCSWLQTKENLFLKFLIKKVSNFGIYQVKRYTQRLLNSQYRCHCLLQAKIYVNMPFKTKN